MGRKFLKKGESALKFSVVFEPSKTKEGEDDHTVEVDRPTTRTLVPMNERRRKNKGDLPEGMKESVWTTQKTAVHEAEKQWEKDMDFYFPQDGYNYNKHLREMGKGVFIPATEVPDEPERPDNLDKVHMQVYDALDGGTEAGYEEFDSDEDVLGLLGGEAATEPASSQSHPYDPVLDDPLYDGEDSDAESDGTEEPLDRSAKANQELADVLAEYDDDQIGDLQREEIEGECEKDFLEEVVDEFIEVQKAYQEEDMRIYNVDTSGNTMVSSSSSSSAIVSTGFCALGGRAILLGLPIFPG
uniref:Uncharacterized protein n=1 Tax=Oxyrrhis marina TaxID=2969 RepID=A0A7S3UJM1_OXYMA